jgi:hypothetical protein
MPFTVVRPEKIGVEEFTTYHWLLRKQGWDVLRTRRTQEPASGQRWLPVWEKREEAERFAEALARETEKEAWNVIAVPADSVSEGPLGLIELNVGCQGNSGFQGPEYVYELGWHANIILDAFFPTRERLKMVMFELVGPPDFEADQKRWGLEAARLLTGLEREEIDRLGGFLINDPTRDRTVYFPPGRPVSVESPAKDPSCSGSEKGPRRRKKRRPA